MCDSVRVGKICEDDVHLVVTTVNKGARVLYVE